MKSLQFSELLGGHQSGFFSTEFWAKKLKKTGRECCWDIWMPLFKQFCCKLKEFVIRRFLYVFWRHSEQQFCVNLCYQRQALFVSGSVSRSNVTVEMAVVQSLPMTVMLCVNGSVSMCNVTVVVADFRCRTSWWLPCCVWMVHWAGVSRLWS